MSRRDDGRERGAYLIFKFENAKTVIYRAFGAYFVDASSRSGQCGNTGDKPMTSWMKERDRLVEQTLAFVQGVHAQRPIQVAVSESPAPMTVAEIPVAVTEIPAPCESALPESPAFSETRVASSETDMLISLIALSQATERSDRIAQPSEPIAAAELPPLIHVTVEPPRPGRPSKPPLEMGLPERDVIEQRVARFRAGQRKLIQDRNDNYALVQAKIRETLGKNP